MTYDTPYQPKPDSGTLKATLSKAKDVSPDYWGDIHINMNDMTAVKVENGLTVFKLSGWKRIDKNGKTYLSLSVNRWVPQDQPAPAPQEPDFPEEDLPF
jgi:hypothetical protein